MKNIMKKKRTMLALYERYKMGPERREICVRRDVPIRVNVKSVCAVRQSIDSSVDMDTFASVNLTEVDSALD